MNCFQILYMNIISDLFNKVLVEGKMPEEWRKSFVVPIFKGKGDMISS